MLVSVACRCGHVGFARRDRLPASLKCVRCGRSTMFSRGAALHDVVATRLPEDLTLPELLKFDSDVIGELMANNPDDPAW
jgi:hypothetical protein